MTDPVQPVLKDVLSDFLKNFLLHILDRVLKDPLVIIFLVLAFGGGAFWGGSKIGNEALDEEFNYSSILFGEKVEQFQFLNDFESKSRTSLFIWNSILTSRGEEGETEYPQYMLESLKKSYFDSTDKFVSKLSVRKQYTYFYYLASVSTALAEAIGNASEQELPDFLERSEFYVNKLFTFTNDNSVSLGPGWMNDKKIVLRNKYLKASSACINAKHMAGGSKRQQKILEIYNLVQSFPEHYLKAHAIDDSHPTIGGCLQEARL